MKQYFVCTAVVLAALSGCTDTDSASGRVIEVQFTAPSSKTLKGYESTPVIVRAKADQTKLMSPIREQSGVPCSLQGDGYKASFTTPVSVLLPDYGRASGPVSVTCEWQGITRTAKVSAYDATSGGIQSSVTDQAGGGLGGALLGVVAGGIASIDKKDNNDWKYPPIEVVFGSVAPKS